MTARRLNPIAVYRDVALKLAAVVAGLGYSLAIRHGNLPVLAGATVTTLFAATMFAVLRQGGRFHAFAVGFAIAGCACYAVDETDTHPPTASFLADAFDRSHDTTASPPGLAGFVNPRPTASQRDQFVMCGRTLLVQLAGLSGGLLAVAARSAFAKVTCWPRPELAQLES